MDEETRNRIADFFDANVLVEYLNISTLDIVHAFEDELLEVLEELEELMGINNEPLD